MARVTEAGVAPPKAMVGPRPMPRWRRALTGQAARDNALRIGTFIGILLIWQALSLVIKPIIFTSPGGAIEALVTMIQDGSLWEAWNETLFVMLVALTLAGTLGVILGILLGRFRTASALVDPEVTAVFLTPKVALLPLIALWFGFGDAAKIVVVFLFSFFEVFFTVRNGVRTIDREYVEVARAYCIPERMMLTRVVVPASLPYIATGLRLGLIHGMVGVVLVGFFLETNGIGGMLYYFGQDFQIAELFAGLFTVMLVGVAINVTLRWVERRVAPWRGAQA
jgi:sulfonate transport system permease protein